MSIGLIATCALGGGGGTDFLCGFGTAYGIEFDANGNNYLVWKQAGATFSTTWHFPPYQPIHLYATRISQVVRFYVNGRKVATSGTLTTPTGNGTSRFYIQANNSVGYNGGTGFCSLKVTPSGLSDAQVLAEHNLTLGQVFAL
jgi:hypothetical protein